MGQLIKADGTERDITPRSGAKFKFKGELYELLACKTIQHIHLADGRLMLMDEDAKHLAVRKPYNVKATRLLHAAGGARHDRIEGDVVVIERGEL